MQTPRRINPLRDLPKHLALAGTTARLAVTLAALALAGQVAHAVPTVWNVNIGGDLTTSDNFVGAAPENTANSTWNSLGNTNLLPLVDSTGAAGTVTAQLGVAGGTLGFTGNVGYLPKIFTTWCKHTGNTLPVAVTFGGLSPAGTYDLIVYADWYWQSGLGVPITQTTGTGMSGTVTLNNFNDAYGTVHALVRDTDLANNTSIRGNWLRITGLTPSASGILGFNMNGKNSPLSGFQLVQTSAGATDTTPPTLTYFVDDRSGASVVEYRPVTYTLTFSEAMDAATIDATDFENASSSAITVNSVAATANPAVFLVTVTPTGAGTLRLQVKAAAILKDLAGNNLVTTPAVQDDTPITVDADTTVPTLTSFVDNKSGGPILSNQTVTYTVTFSEAMNTSTVNASDFENASATATTIGSVTPTANPAIFLVDATPTAAGTLQLRIKAGATLTDLKGNAMVIGSGIPDDTTIVVNAPTILVCPLGVLNLSANSGINPATGQLWKAGDKYRLIFVTSGVTACDSTDISTYNAYVQGLANASTAFPALRSVTWKVVGSTATVAARDNTGTNPGVNGTGEPIIRMDGAFAIANNYADLWNGIIASHATGLDFLAVHLDENNVSRTDERVRTGSVANGTATGGQELGTGDVQTGRNYAPNGYGYFGANSWMADWHASGPGRVYAISPPITLQANYANMLTFGLAGNPAVIRDTNITLTVPYGTDVTALVPTFTLSPGATCVPVSGTARNFTTPQTYTVTSSDSLVTQQYTATVVTTPPPPEFTLTAPAT